MDIAEELDEVNISIAVEIVDKVVGAALDDEVNVLIVVDIVDDVLVAVLDDVEVSLPVEFCQADPTSFAFIVTPLVSPPVEKTLTSVPSSFGKI